MPTAWMLETPCAPPPWPPWPYRSEAVEGSSPASKENGTAKPLVARRVPGVGPGVDAGAVLGVTTAVGVTTAAPGPTGCQLTPSGASAAIRTVGSTPAGSMISRPPSVPINTRSPLGDQ